MSVTLSAPRSDLVTASSDRTDVDPRASEPQRRGLGSRTDEVGDATLLSTWADTQQSARTRQDAFRELVARHGDRVFAVCLRELGCRHDAEDATQDTFAKAARAAASFRGDSKVTTWMHRIAINTCRDLQRRHARRPTTPTGDVQALAIPTSTDQPDETAEAAIANDLATVIQHALARLDPSVRTLVVLCAIQGMSYPEAAKVLDIPVGTIKSRIFRARAKIAANL